MNLFAYGLNKRYIDGLLAENVYYNEIIYKKLTDSQTGVDYFLTTIPHLDSDGNLIKLKHGYANDQMNLINASTGKVDGESARSFGERNNVCFASNASIWDTTTTKIKGVQIQNGVVLQNNDGGSSYTLGIKADNTLVTYDSTVSASTMLADGVVDTVTGFFPLIIDGVPVDATIYAPPPDGNGVANTTSTHPRNAIGQMPNKDIVYLTTDTNDDVTGFTYSDMIRIFQGLGVTFAYCLDGGGSAQTVVRGVTLNKPTDSNGTVERKVADFLYIKKDATYPQNVYTESHDLGFANKRSLDALGGLNALGNLKKIITTVTDFDAISKSGLYWSLSTGNGIPDTTGSWGVLHFQIGSLSALQIAFPYSNSGIFKVRKRDSSGTWGTWNGLDVGNYGSNPVIVTDFNDVPKISGKYYGVNNSIANAPGTGSWLVDHTQIGSIAAIQVAYAYDSTGTIPAKKRICTGSTSPGVWQPWTAL